MRANFDAFFERATRGNWIDIGTQEIDDYYYKSLGFDVNSPSVSHLSRILDTIVQLFEGRKAPKLKAYEAIHLVLLVDSLMNGYAKSWYSRFMKAYDVFKEKAALAKREKAGEYWNEFGVWTQTDSSSARAVQRRHAFFLQEMLRELDPVLLDETRIFGEVEREIIYYRDKKHCVVCGDQVRWDDLEIHHVMEYQHGGKTSLDNGVSVHKGCHPKGQDAVRFRERWELSKTQIQKENAGDASDFSIERKQVRGSVLPPDGTDCQFVYNSKKFKGKIVNGQIAIEGIVGMYGSFSAASRAVTDTSRNGWADWKLCFPGSDEWIVADIWRNSQAKP